MKTDEGPQTIVRADHGVSSGTKKPYWERLKSSLQMLAAGPGSVTAPKRIGLALSGGGALGAAHIGVLEVLQQHGIRPSCLAGTSAGSAVGVAYCAGVSLEKMTELATNLSWGMLGRMVRPRCGFFDGTRLERLIVKLIGDRTFDELPMRFAAVAADILRDELVILREGRVAPAVRASCAFPGVFTPVEYAGRLLVDGGLINNLPVSAVRELGADYVIAVDLGAPSVVPRKPPTTLVEMWFLSLSTLIRNTNREAALADAVIVPDTGEFNWFDLSSAPILIERGRLAAHQRIPQILKDLEMEAGVAG